MKWQWTWVAALALTVGCGDEKPASVRVSWNADALSIAAGDAKPSHVRVEVFYGDVADGEPAFEAGPVPLDRGENFDFEVEAETPELFFRVHATAGTGPRAITTHYGEFARRLEATAAGDVDVTLTVGPGGDVVLPVSLVQGLTAWPAGAVLVGEEGRFSVPIRCDADDNVRLAGPVPVGSYSVTWPDRRVMDGGAAVLQVEAGRANGGDAVSAPLCVAHDKIAPCAATTEATGRLTGCGLFAADGVDTVREPEWEKESNADGMTRPRDEEGPTKPPAGDAAGAGGADAGEATPVSVEEAVQRAIEDVKATLGRDPATRPSMDAMVALVRANLASEWPLGQEPDDLDVIIERALTPAMDSEQGPADKPEPPVTGEPEPVPGDVADETEANLRDMEEQIMRTIRGVMDNRGSASGGPPTETMLRDAVRSMLDKAWPGGDFPVSREALDALVDAAVVAALQHAHEDPDGLWEGPLDPDATEPSDTSSAAEDGIIRAAIYQAMASLDADGTARPSFDVLWAEARRILEDAWPENEAPSDLDARIERLLTVMVPRTPADSEGGGPPPAPTDVKPEPPSGTEDGPADDVVSHADPQVSDAVYAAIDAAIRDLMEHVMREQLPPPTRDDLRDAIYTALHELEEPFDREALAPEIDRIVEHTLTTLSPGGADGPVDTHGKDDSHEPVPTDVADGTRNPPKTSGGSETSEPRPAVADPVPTEPPDPGDAGLTEHEPEPAWHDGLPPEVRTLLEDAVDHAMENQLPPPDRAALWRAVEHALGANEDVWKGVEETYLVAAIRAMLDTFLAEPTEDVHADGAGFGTPAPGDTDHEDGTADREPVPTHPVPADGVPGAVEGVSWADIDGLIGETVRDAMARFSREVLQVVDDGLLSDAAYAAVQAALERASGGHPDVGSAGTADGTTTTDAVRVDALTLRDLNAVIGAAVAEAVENAVPVAADAGEEKQPE